MPIQPNTSVKLLSIIPLTPVLILATLAAPLVARAADSVTFRAVCFDPRETETPELFVAREGSRKPLEIDKSSLSGPQKASVRDGRFVDFYKSEEATPGELPSVTLSLPGDSADNLLFVFAPAGASYRAWAIKLSPNDFKPGARLIVNAAPVEVAVKLGTAAPTVVQPGASGIVLAPDGIKDSMVSVQIFNRKDKSEPWRISQNTSWGVDLESRSYLFFYQTPESPRLMLHGVAERMKSGE